MKQNLPNTRMKGLESHTTGASKINKCAIYWYIYKLS